MACETRSRRPHPHSAIVWSQDLVSRLTLDEMARGGANNNCQLEAIYKSLNHHPLSPPSPPPPPQVTLRPYPALLSSPTSGALSGDVDAGPATSFPQAIGVAATFDFNAVYDLSRTIVNEVRARVSFVVHHRNDTLTHTHTHRLIPSCFIQKFYYISTVCVVPLTLLYMVPPE